MHARFHPIASRQRVARRDHHGRQECRILGKELKMTLGAKKQEEGDYTLPTLSAPLNHTTLRNTIHISDSHNGGSRLRCLPLSQNFEWKAECVKQFKILETSSADAQLTLPIGSPYILGCQDLSKGSYTHSITLSLSAYEGFDFSGQQSLQDFYQLIKCATSTAFKSHYYDDILGHIPISPNFRAAFYTPLGDSLIQAARNAEDMVPGGPTQSDNQPDLDGSLQEKTQNQKGNRRTVEKKGQRHWDNLRTHFKVQVNELEESVKEVSGTAEISG
ncbi:hypothetical protein C8J57DRAFT_1242088 [Mycena rebaudengoi]|nr:hypothetical protein C8J57DRAFT_1242088 [Mycena rebaudengoi]